MEFGWKTEAWPPETQWHLKLRHYLVKRFSSGRKMSWSKGSASFLGQSSNSDLGNCHLRRQYQVTLGVLKPCARDFWRAMWRDRALFPSVLVQAQTIPRPAERPQSRVLFRVESSHLPCKLCTCVHGKKWRRKGSHSSSMSGSNRLA